MTTSRITRRSVAQGLAWSAPAVALAAAAPAHAASCTPVTRSIDWASSAYKPPTNPRGNDSKTATYTWPDPDGPGRGEALTLTITQSFGSNTRPGSQVYNGMNKGTITNYNFNLLPSTTNGGAAATVGGTGLRGLTIHKSPIRDDRRSNEPKDVNRAITTFTFSHPVTSLSFTITDVDSDDAFRDAVALTSPTPYTAQLPPGGRFTPGPLTGSGTLTNPWTTRGENMGDVDNWTGTDGNITITFTQPVTTFSIHYWDLRTGTQSIDQHQRIYLAGFQNFSYAPCVE